MIMIQASALKAALISAPTKDVRYYLNGVVIRITDAGNVYIMSTDGPRAFIGKLTNAWIDEPQLKALDIIIPVESVKDALMSKIDSLSLLSLQDGVYSLGSVIFTPIQGKFPDLGKVIPSALTFVCANYNAKYLADAEKALKLWDNDKNGYYELQQNGTGIALMTCKGAQIVIMPRLGKATAVASFQIV